MNVAGDGGECDGCGGGSGVVMVNGMMVVNTTISMAINNDDGGVDE